MASGEVGLQREANEAVELVGGATATVTTRANKRCSEITRQMARIELFAANPIELSIAAENLIILIILSLPPADLRGLG